MKIINNKYNFKNVVKKKKQKRSDLNKNHIAIVLTKIKLQKRNFKEIYLQNIKNFI